MQDSPVTATTTTDHVVLLSCSLCGPVGVYSCGVTLAITHHMSTHE